MPKVRINVTLDKELAEFMKTYAEKNYTTVSMIFNQYAARLKKEESPVNPSETTITGAPVQGKEENIWLVPGRVEGQPEGWYSVYATSADMAHSIVEDGGGDWEGEEFPSHLVDETITMSPDTFAIVLGFEHYEALLEASETIYQEGDISWFVTRLPGDKFAAWDEAELAFDRVEHFNTRGEAENYQRDALGEQTETV